MTQAMRLVLFIVLISLLPAVTLTAIIHVPGDSTTIQAGIDGALNGDTVLVAAGTYTGDGNRDIRFDGKAILVKSEAGPEATTINLQKIPGYRAFVIEDYEDTTSIIDGFTVRDNGVEGTGGMGGCIMCEASPTIRNCNFTGCIAGLGSAIYVSSNNNPIISDCTFTNDTSYSGTVCFGVYATVIGCSFIENYGELGQIHCYGNSEYGSYVIKSCTFANNGPSLLSAGIYMRDFASLHVENCLFFYGFGWSNIYCEAGCGDVEIVSTDMYDLSGSEWDSCFAAFQGINGNFSADPLFCDPENGDYSISALSPCAPAHNSSGRYIGALKVGCGFVCGDANGDSETNVADAVYMINFIFKGGPEPGPICAADANGDGNSNVGDIVYTISYVFKGGPPPVEICCLGH